MSFAATRESGILKFFLQSCAYIFCLPAPNPRGGLAEEKYKYKRHICDMLAPVLSKKVEVFSVRMRKHTKLYENKRVYDCVSTPVHKRRSVLCAQSPKRLKGVDQFHW